MIYFFRAVWYSSLSIVLLLGQPPICPAQTLAYNRSQQPQQKSGEVAKLRDVLLDMQSQYRINIVFNEDVIAGRTVDTRRLSGSMSVTNRLRLLLEGSGLQVVQTQKDTYLILSANRSEKTNGSDPPETLKRAQTSTQSLLPLEPPAANPQLAPTIQVADVVVSGRVRDENGTGLPGVSVVLKESGPAARQRGTTTNADGDFSISVPDRNAILVFSFVGYQKQEIAVGSQSVLGVTLSPDDQSLNEVVVVGYGTTKKSDLTGAISSVKADQIQAFPVVSVDRALQGRAAGVQVLSNTGQPGGGITIRIRGVGTVNNNDPLYVIDGVPVFNDPSASSGSLRGNAQLQNPLSMINPNDIESLEILKDASATAIYGSRANNGVVLITTKRGKEGKLRVSYDGFGGFNQMQSDYGQMNAREWATYGTNLLTVSNLTADPRLAALKSITDNPNPPTYDWAGEAIRKGSIQSHQIGVSGGTKNSQFFLSGNYYDENGTIISSWFKRYSFRLNSDHRINDKLKFGNTLTLSRTDQRLAPTDNGNNSVLTSLNRVPVQPIYLDDGRYSAGGIWQTNRHYIAVLQQEKETLQTQRVLGSLYAEYQIVPSLAFRTSGSIDQIGSVQQLFVPPYDVEGAVSSILPANATLTTQNRQSFTWFTDNYFTFKKQLAQHHDLTVTGGISAQRTSNRTYGASVSNFFSGNYPYLGAGINQGNVSGGEIRSALFSYFMRGNYSYRDKYLLTATVRRDGSSRFGSDNRFGTFPAVSVGWRLTEEPFLKNSSLFSTLKLRASWGKSGGQEIGDYTAYSILGTNFNYVIGNNLVGGVAPLSLANPRLQWEATVQTNVGVDAGVLNNRLSFTADYFVRNTTKLLLRTLTPLEQGAVQSPFSNQGEIQNRGIELGINAVILNGPLRWSIDANFTAIRNRVLALANSNAPRLTTASTSNFAVPTFITQVGDPIGRFLLYDAQGTFQTWDEIYNAPRQNTPIGADGKPSLPQTNVTQQTAPGDLRFRDVDGNGIIDLNDRVVVGKIIPDFTWGMTHQVSYKGLSLSVFLLGVQGVDTYNGFRAFLERMNTLDFNASRTVLNAWRSDNTSTPLPRAIIQDPNNNNRASTRFLENGSFVRVKNVRIAYNLPSVLLKPVRLSAVQIYVSAVNLLTFTKYTGLDPELGNQNSSAELGNYDAGQYPVSKQYLAGLKISF